MARILSRDGHRVITASTGTEGVRLAQEQQPDIAIVDVMLPDMNEPVELGALQKAPKGSNGSLLRNILALTSSEQTVSYNNATENGSNG